MFVTCDIVSFIIQTIGVVTATSKDVNTKMTGFTMMKIGLIVQLVCFGFFIIISLRFHVVSRRFQQHWPDMRWPRFLKAINIASTLIFVSYLDTPKYRSRDKHAIFVLG